MIKQFIPSEYCLKCKNCCRFAQENSVWAPCLLDEEMQALIDKEGIPAATISIERRIDLLPNPQGEGFICPFLNLADNKCRIYDWRPFECQLYPFLITLRGKKVLLTVDLNCPYIKEKIKSQELKDYIEYLSAYLNCPQQLKLLKDNPQIIQAYDEVCDLLELKTIDETQ